MIHCIARPTSSNEQCLLSGFEHNDLVIKNEDTDETEATIKAPKNGWTYDSLEKACNEHQPQLDSSSAYLAEQWIGSTEV